MQYTTLGRTGVTISEVGLGTMGFGSGKYSDRKWTLPKEESVEIIERAIDLGINFFDTANDYSGGEAEEILGEVLAEHDRDWSVVSTKVHSQMDPENPNSGGLSRKGIEQETQNSLDRLGMDTVDILHMHASDPTAGADVTMQAFDDLVQRGKARCIGVSSMWTWELSELVRATERLNLEPITVMQNHYSLAYREEERDMLPFCRNHEIGVIPYSPLARGYLTRPHEEWHETTRGADEATVYDHQYHEGGGQVINERVEELAADKGVSMAQIGISWLLHQEEVDAPILGVSSIEHLEDLAEAVEISLSDSDLEYLEEPYEASQIAGHMPVYGEVPDRT